MAHRRGRFTGTDATCVLDLASTCHTGGWCFGATLGYWHVPYAPRINIASVLGHPWGGISVGPFCGAWWLSAP